MKPDVQLEEAVCVTALHIPEPDLRAQFLDRAGAGDARLRAAVEAMLLANDDAENYFEQCRSVVSASKLDAQALKSSGSRMQELNSRTSRSAAVARPLATGGRALFRARQN